MSLKAPVKVKLKACLGTHVKQHCCVIGRCSGQYGGEDASAGVRTKQEESSGPEEPQPLHAQ